MITGGIKLLSRHRLTFSHFNEQKFRHNFNDMVNPMCTCGLEPETALHYLLHCNLCSTHRLELLDNVSVLNPSLKITLLNFLVSKYIDQKIQL